MGDVRKLMIDGPVGRLEALLREADEPRGTVVLAHPHPLYGGTLHNPVIFHADRELNRAGFTTLRFNFRGVEGSDGFHDDGRGEIGDLAAAAAYVGALAPGRPGIVVGYSFGGRCAIAHAISDRTVAGVVVIGLATRVFNFDDLPSLGRPLSIVQGTEDEFGSIEAVNAVISRAAPPGRLYEIDGASHLFPGRAPEAAAKVVEAVKDMLRARP